MYLEALIRLAEVLDKFESEKKSLISEKYHKETRELIEYLSKSLVTELEFKQLNPGPYSFGFGDIELNIFSPDHTDKQEWAALVRTNGEQMQYRFNSIMGLIKVLTKIADQDGTED